MDGALCIERDPRPTSGIPFFVLVMLTVRGCRPRLVTQPVVSLCHGWESCGRGCLRATGERGGGAVGRWRLGGGRGEGGGGAGPGLRGAGGAARGQSPGVGGA